jgi:biotin carboxylase
MTDSWLIAVGAGRWQMSGIGAAQAENIRVFAIDGSKDAPGLTVAERFAVVDISDAAAVVRAVVESGISPLGAISFVSDAGMMAAAALREMFGLYGLDRNASLLLTNKCRQRRAWTDAGLPCPHWRCVTDEQRTEAALRKIDKVVIFKPADSAGSRGVAVVKPGEDWRPALLAALAGSRCGTAIIESFIPGIEYTVETFSHQSHTTVLAISEKKKVRESRGTVASELATPALSSIEINRIGQLAVNALAALGHRDGPGHTEIMRDSNDELWLIEAAGRGGGFMVADGIVPKASGYDLARACAVQAVGRAPPEPPAAPRRAFVLRFLPTRPGIVATISGFDCATALGNVECQPLVAVGDKVGLATTDGARLAYILTWADDRQSALSLADRAEGYLHVEIVPCQ